MNQPIAKERDQSRLIRTAVEVIAAEIIEVIDEERFLFWLDEARAGTAIRASGCLVQPEAGDLVTIHRLSDELAFITDVLRSNSSTTNIVCQKAIRITSEDGIVLSTAKNIHFEVAQSIKIAATLVEAKLSRVKVLSDLIGLHFRKLCKVGVEVETKVMKMRLMAQYIFQDAKSYIRNTSDTESAQSGTYSQKVSGMAVSESQYFCLIAQKDARLDGERIHIG